ncbi:hypothetical protein [Sporisorium scitamineum]|uniref:Uncharacterized protein n=1 Tax=Sporisorium scitamineum TaxID=49012 RepID=A0A0F7S3P0_9BASI|nr:hypothetical protein [Sporisorium scitamineum]
MPTTGTPALTFAGIRIKFTGSAPSLVVVFPSGSFACFCETDTEVRWHKSQLQAAAFGTSTSSGFHPPAF